VTLELICSGLSQGLILSIVALGIMIPFRFLNFPDLSADGAYPLGGAVCATLLISGASTFTSLIFASIAGGLLSFATSQLAIRLKLNSLLSGIILSTMAYSINLRIMGKPNIALFDLVDSLFNLRSLFAIVISCVLLLAFF
jgi:putative tryptophan/tyrosine transport system permease protein